MATRVMSIRYTLNQWMHTSCSRFLNDVLIDEEGDNSYTVIVTVDLTATSLPSVVTELADENRSILGECVCDGLVTVSGTCGLLESPNGSHVSLLACFWTVMSSEFKCWWFSGTLDISPFLGSTESEGVASVPSAWSEDCMEWWEEVMSEGGL